MAHIKTLLGVSTAALVLCWLMSTTSACSCQLEHPQMHACRAHFVIVARIQGYTESNNEMLKYSLKIWKKFKMTRKAQRALKSGKLFTPKHSSMCGEVNLAVNQTYLLTGRVNMLSAHTNVCNFNRPWTKLSLMQRKGFRKWYRKACDKRCEVVNCPTHIPNCSKDLDTCNWTMFDQCTEKHGVCLPGARGQCSWVGNKALRNCEKARESREP